MGNLIGIIGTVDWKESEMPNFSWRKTTTETLVVYEQVMNL